MNRRNCLKLLAGLLPCAIAAKLYGTTTTPEPHTPTFWTPPPTTNPAYKDAQYEALIYSPAYGFHTTIKELGVRYDMEGNRLEPCFRATIRDCTTNHIMAIQSPVFTDDRHRRFALDILYKNIAYVTRQRQFPKDTLIYDVEQTASGVKYTNPRYPDEPTETNKAAPTNPV